EQIETPARDGERTADAEPTGGADHGLITSRRDDHSLSQHWPDLPPGGASLRPPSRAALRDLSRADAQGVRGAQRPRLRTAPRLTQRGRGGRAVCRGNREQFAAETRRVRLAGASNSASR